MRERRRTNGCFCLRIFQISKRETGIGPERSIRGVEPRERDGLLEGERLEPALEGDKGKEEDDDDDEAEAEAGMLVLANILHFHVAFLLLMPSR